MTLFATEGPTLTMCSVISLQGCCLWCFVFWWEWVKNNKASDLQCHIIHMVSEETGRSQWPRGPRRRSTAARLLRLWVRIPPGGMDVCLLWVLCVIVRYRSLRRAGHSSRGVLPTVVRHCVWSRNLTNEEPRPISCYWSKIEDVSLDIQ